MHKNLKLMRTDIQNYKIFKVLTIGHEEFYIYKQEYFYKSGFLNKIYYIVIR